MSARPQQRRTRCPRRTASIPPRAAPTAAAHPDEDGAVVGVACTVGRQVGAAHAREHVVEKHLVGALHAAAAAAAGRVSTRTHATLVGSGAATINAAAGHRSSMQETLTTARASTARAMRCSRRSSARPARQGSAAAPSRPPAAAAASTTCSASIASEAGEAVRRWQRSAAGSAAVHKLLRLCGIAPPGLGARPNDCRMFVGVRQLATRDARGPRRPPRTGPAQHRRPAHLRCCGCRRRGHVEKAGRPGDEKGAHEAGQAGVGVQAGHRSTLCVDQHVLPEVVGTNAAAGSVSVRIDAAAARAPGKYCEWRGPCSSRSCRGSTGV